MQFSPSTSDFSQFYALNGRNILPLHASILGIHCCFLFVISLFAPGQQSSSSLRQPTCPTARLRKAKASPRTSNSGKSGACLRAFRKYPFPWKNVAFSCKMGISRGCHSPASVPIAVPVQLGLAPGKVCSTDEQRLLSL